MASAKRLLSINHAGLENLAFEDRMRLLYMEGVTAAGISFEDVMDLGVAEVKRILELYPLRLTLASSVGYFNQANKKAYLKARVDDEEKIEIASELGIETILALAGPAEGISPVKARTVLVEGLSLLSRKIEMYCPDMRIALEPVSPLFQGGPPFIASAREALEAIDEVDRPNVGLMADLYHLWQEPGIIGTLESAGRRIFGCQLSDWRSINRSREDRVLPGDGCIPLVELLGALERSGWRDWYEIEILSEELRSMDPKAFVVSCKRTYEELWRAYDRSIRS
jgi:sugar phosphate isomerase/epimerase